MIRRLSIIACLCLGLATAHAQQAHHSEIIIGHQGLDALKADLSYLLSLTSPQEQAQENVIGIIEIMELGLDLTRPMRIDFLSGMNPPNYIITMGYESEDDLIDNIEGAGFPLKESGSGLWELLEPDQGWFRAISRTKTGILVFTTPKNHALLRQLIQKMDDPLPAVAPLLEGGANIAIQLTNKAQTEADQKLRRDSFAELRAVHMDSLQKRPSELQTRFDLRKRFVSNRLDEIERLLVEASAASAKIMLDKESGVARVLFDAQGIPDSSFANSIAEFGKRKDVFASVKKNAEAILHVRGNHALDEMRQKNLSAIVDLVEADAIDQMKKDAKTSASEQEATEKLLKGVSELTKDALTMGNINGFAETMLDDKGEFITYGALILKDGQRLDEILPIIAQTGSSNKITPAVAKIGDVTIHEVTFGKGFYRPFDLVFEGKTGYIGTSADIVWIGTGGQSVLEPLKAAIADLKEPAETDIVLEIDGNVEPWAKRAKRVLEGQPEPTEASDKTQRRDNMRRLGLAVDAFTSNDDMRFSMKIKDGTANGEIFVNTGMLRFVGKLLADFSKNNLE